MDDLQTIQNRLLRARLEAIGTAGEILRVSLGAGSLEKAVHTILTGIGEILPASLASIWEARPDGFLELGRRIDGRETPALGHLSPDQVPPLLRHGFTLARHEYMRSAPALRDGQPTGLLVVPFEGLVGLRAGEEPLISSHLLWLEGFSDQPSPEIMDPLIALASQAGVQLTGFRYREDLERTYAALRSANQRLQHDIDRARRIQEGLLPAALPRLPGLDLASRYRPAEKVSGDYFDCFPLDPGQPTGAHGLVMADVSGHGISSAMVMAMFKVMLRRECGAGTRPAEILAGINRILLDQIAGLHHVTVFFAVYDPLEGSLDWCSAGHCPQYLVRSDGSLEELLGDGLFLGMFDDPGLVDRRTRLGPGDTLALFTDGIIEAETPDGNLFGEERLQEILVAHRAAPPAALLDRFCEELDRLSGGAPPADDVTLLALRA